LQRQIFPTLVAALALAGLATPALAQDTNVVPPDAGAVAAATDFDGDSITVGGGFVYLPDYEGSNDYRFTPAPGAIGSFRGHSFTVAGNRASVDLIRNQPGPSWDFQAGPIAVVNFNRTNTDNIDDRRVRALGERDTAIELGGYVGIGKTGVITSPYDQLSVSVSYRHDVAGSHDSGILQPTINYVTPLSRKAAFGLFASAEHVERGYGRAYFGVDAAQSVASGFPVYGAPRGWKNWTVGALGTYALTGDLLHGFKLVGGGTYGRQFDRFADSPVVRIAGKRSQWLGVLGVAYTF
jgi:outer membrane scaffolding protein for murein synthesis (MipA/OmpV family)